MDMEPLGEAADGKSSPPSFWPYLLPMAVFLGLTQVESYLPRAPDGSPDLMWYPFFYTVKMAAVLITMFACRATWRDLRPAPTFPHVMLSVLLGVVIAVLWVGLEQVPYPKLSVSGGRQAFDPTHLRPLARAGFLTVRMLGLVVLVPVFEELFWRSFLVRWLISPEFSAVPIGRVTLNAALLTSLLFALAHPEWLPAFLCGLAWAFLLHRTRSVSTCVISHAVANLGLGLYVLYAGAWRFW